MATGISVSDDVISLFDDFKLKRTKHKYLVLSIQDNEVKLKDTLGKETTHEDFCAALDDNPCYVCIDFDYTTTDGRPADKIILLSWIPDTARVKEKMKYSGTKEAVKSSLSGIGLNINATDKSECTTDVLIAECNKI